MASTDRPIPLPPRTPPPLDPDPLNGFSNSPTKSVYDPNALSPMDENFPVSRKHSIPTFTTTNLPLADDTNSIYSPMSVESNESNLPSSRRPSSLMVEDANGVFNFTPAMMKVPTVAKSVSYIRFLPQTSFYISKDLSADHLDRTSRAWDSAAATNTNTAASPTSSSSNPHRDRRFPSQTPFPSPPSKSAGAACPARKPIASTGLYAIWQWQPTRSGVPKVRSP